MAALATHDYVAVIDLVRGELDREPTRADLTSARRAALRLADDGKAHAVYLLRCTGCSALFSTGRAKCCGRITDALVLTTNIDVKTRMPGNASRRVKAAYETNATQAAHTVDGSGVSDASGVDTPEAAHSAEGGSPVSVTHVPDGTEASHTLPDDDELDRESGRLESLWRDFLDDIPRLVDDYRKAWEDRRAAVAAWERKGRTAKGREGRGEKPGGHDWYWDKTADRYAAFWVCRAAADIIVVRIFDDSPYTALGEVLTELAYAAKIDVEEGGGLLSPPTIYQMAWDAYSLAKFRAFEKPAKERAAATT